MGTLWLLNFHQTAGMLILKRHNPVDIYIYNRQPFVVVAGSEHCMAKIKSEINKSLESWIWDAACSIRGAKDAPKYKDTTPRCAG